MIDAEETFGYNTDLFVHFGHTGASIVKALVVDDVKVNCRVLKGLLDKYGECDVVLNARDAVNAFQTAWKAGAPYNLLCLDIMLPDVDGIRLLEIVRKLESSMKLSESQCAHVIMITAVDDIAHREKAKKLGVDGYLTKPIFRNSLEECLKKAKLIPDPAAGQ